LSLPDHGGVPLIKLVAALPAAVGAPSRSTKSQQESPANTTAAAISLGEIARL
jgi:hypothetical protein